MSQYVLRRLLIAVPSLLGISLVLFIVLALAPGDPFSELATNPERAARSRGRASGQVRPRRSDLPPLPALDHRHAAGRLGLFLRQPDERRHADPAAPADDALCDRLGATAGARDRDPGRRLCRDEALFDLRPDRQHARLYRLFAADLLHRPAVHPAVFDHAGLAAFRLHHRHQGDRLPLGDRTDPAGHHAGDGARRCFRRPP